MKFNRWVYAIVGFIVMLCAGLVYAWTNISKPIKVEALGSTALNIDPEHFAMTFSICMGMFCIGGLIGGIIIKRYHPKVNMIIAVILFPIGLIISANSYSYLGLYIGYGLFVGFASGLVYNAVLSAVTRWFQDKQGLISGILLMGFGLGGFILGPVAKVISDSMGWRASFIVIAIAFTIILLLSTFFIVLPTSDFVLPTNPNKKARPGVEGALDIGPLEMIKRPAFIFFFIWSVLMCSTGLSMIPNANAFTQSVSNMDEMGLVMIAGIISIFNGLGRVLFGTIYDHKGNKVAITLDSLLFILSSVILLVALQSNSIVLTVAGFIGVGLSYGGAPTNSSAFINSFYGNRNYPLNLPVLNLSLFVGSFIGPNIAQAFIGSSIGFTGVTIAMIIFSIISFFITFFLKRP